jgi:chromosome segregation ATPase
MRQITRAKKLEVAHYYILGHPYSDIVNRSGVSHGSVVNIVRELECGKLAIPGTPFDQVNDLRQLSLELKKKGLEPSQALLGVLLFDRLRVLGITPDVLEKWSELARKLLPVDFPAKDFLEAALRLDELEKSEGKPFATLATEYVRLKEGADELKAVVRSLTNTKEELVRSIKSLRTQAESLERSRDKLQNAVEIQTSKLTETKSKTEEIEQERLRLSREIKELRRRKGKLSAEVGDREELLARLNDIGLSEEDLLRITNFIERTSKNQGISGNELKDKFLSTLGLFQDISVLENRKNALRQEVSELVKKKSILSGEITELDSKKGLLEGEIRGIVSSTLDGIRTVGEDAAAQVQQQVADIKEQLNALLADALKAGEAIGEMRQAWKIGEESEKSLSKFIEEVQSRLGRS